MLLTWFLLSSIYLSFGMSQKANIRNMNYHVVNDHVESKKEQFENGFLKQDYPFK